MPASIDLLERIALDNAFPFDASVRLLRDVVYGVTWGHKSDIIAAPMTEGPRATARGPSSAKRCYLAPTITVFEVTPPLVKRTQVFLPESESTGWMSERRIVHGPISSRKCSTLRENRRTVCSVKASVTWALALSMSAAGLVMAPGLAYADTQAVITPIGALEMTIDGGSFTEECTDFPYVLVVSDALPRVQWSAEINAARDGGGSVTDMLTDFGSGAFGGDLQICSGDGAGSWTAMVAVRMADPADTTAVYNRTMTLSFTISKATTMTMITRVNAGSSRTKVKGTVADAQVAMFGDVTVKVKKPSASWKTGGTVTVDEDGNFSVTIGKTYPAGTKFKAVFAGTDEAKGSSSAVFVI
jgi:hypothetical protein